jgi:signal peptide peptidase SppA
MSILSRLFGARGQTITPAQALAAVANRPMMMTTACMDALIATAQMADAKQRYGADSSGDFAWPGSQPEHLISVKDGVGTIAIHGPLFARWDVYVWYYGGTAYDVIGAAFDSLIADAGISQIVLHIDSGGGAVQGCFELAGKIASERGTKPIIAHVDDAAFSAAYLIASAADQIVMPQTGGVGSNGVISTHVDVSRMYDNAGIKYTHVIAGEKKADLSPHAPLSERARADMQAEVNRLHEIQIETVAANRGISADDVRAQQAGCYFGPAAIVAGLADAIGTVESALAETPSDVPEDVPQPDETEPQAIAPEPEPQMVAPAPALSAEDQARIARGMVADALASADLHPKMTAALLAPSAGVTPDTAAARIATARELATICAAAGLPDVAPDYAARNVDVETARAQLLAAKAEDGPELVTARPPGGDSKSGNRSPNAAEIYTERRKATE